MRQPVGVPCSRLVVKADPLTLFTDLGLAEPILRALSQEGYETPTPIQAQAIPPIRDGRDLLGIAQTGTGKTAAFALPILQRLAAGHRPYLPRGCRALVLSPTRELASQIADSFRTYGRHLKLSLAVVFGGVSMGNQVRALSRGVDIVVATPGRLLDHLDGGSIRLDGVEVFVLDEADQMLDMGFIPSIRRVVKALPQRRQNLFLSATMPKPIEALADEWLRDPVKVAVAPVATTAERIDQHVIHVETSAKRGRLSQLLRSGGFGRTLVFSRTKHGADRIVKQLGADGIAAMAIHGNKSQPQREKALAAFKDGSAPVLIATDIAARGIDVDGVTHVVNFDLPHVPETYVHRIGRTARAGAAGAAISLCASEERPLLRDIEKLIRRAIPAIGPVPAEQSGGGQKQHRSQPPRGHTGGGREQPGGARNRRRFHRGGKPKAAAAA